MMKKLRGSRPAQSLPSRRTLLQVISMAFGVLVLKGILKFLDYSEPLPVPLRVLLESPEYYPPGSVTFVADAQSWLVRDDRGLYALAGACTHLGCAIQSVSTRFECPCHGSMFDLNGNVISGPAKKPLPHFELELSPDNTVLLDASQTCPQDQRL